MTAKLCSICLNDSVLINTLHDTDENGEKWTIKLQYIVPEVEWDSNYLICENCIHELRVACNFKEQCLKILNNVKKEAVQENSIMSVKFEENCDSDAPMESGVSLKFEENCDSNAPLESGSVSLKFEENCDSDAPLESDAVSLKFEENGDSDAPMESGDDNDDGEDHKVFICYQCNESFNVKDDLIKHIHDQHKERSITKTVETDYQCIKCKRFYKQMSSLQTHQRSCKEDDTNPLFFCKVCDESFLAPGKLNKHMIEEHKNDIFNCRICNESFNSSLECTNHKKSKHLQEFLGKAGRTFTCDICNMQFESRKVIIEHYVSIHNVEKHLVKPYSCDICSKRFGTSTNLNSHKQYHENNRTNICIICEKSFITKEDLVRHEARHLDDRNHKCKKCEKTFKSMDNLRTHRLIVHGDPMTWKFICDVCGRRFPQKSNYQQHMKRHLGEKKFVCAVCSKSFVTNKEWQKHMDHHSNVKHHRCDQCGKEFRQKTSLALHLTRIHSIGNAKIPVKERKYPCEICPARFYDKSKLTRHVRTHSGLKPFACFACERKFNDKSYLKQHLKKSHNNLEDPDSLKNFTMVK